MAEVDTSIYPKAAAPTNPLTMLGQFAGAQNALNVNKLFQSEFAARTGLGQAAQGAIDPVTGEFDPGAYTRAVGANPDTAFKAPEAARDALAIQQQQIANRRANLELGIKHLDVIQTGLGSLLADPKSTPKDAADLLSRYVAFASDPKHPEGGTIMDAHMAAKTLESIPKAAYDDPAVFQQWLLSHYAAAKGRQGELQAALPNAQPFNLGDRAVFLDRNPITNRTLTGTTATMGLTPEQQVSTTELGLNSRDVPEIGTKVQQLNKLRVGIPQGSITPGIPVRPQALPGNLAPGNALGAVAPPPAPSVAAMPAPAPARAAGGPVPMAAAPGAGNVTGLPTALAPGEAAATGAAKQRSGEALAAERSTAGNYDARNNQAKTALTALQSTKTGPGTEGRNAVLSFALAFPGVGAGLKAVGLDPTKDVAAYDEAMKLLAKNALDQSAAAGAASDAGRALAQVANASTHISNEAAQTVVKMNIGLDRMQTAAVRAFDETGLPESQYAKWKIDWLKGQDPRAYTADLNAPGETKKIHDGLKTEAEKKAFQMSLRNAVELGFIPPKGSK